jgi:hypothetical protein
MVRAAEGRYDRAAGELDLLHLRTRSISMEMTRVKNGQSASNIHRYGRRHCP